MKSKRQALRANKKKRRNNRKRTHYLKQKLFNELKMPCPDWDVVVSILLYRKLWTRSENSSIGNYAVHCACQKNAPEEVVLRLMEMYPEAATYMDLNNGYPLHLACAFNQSETVVKELICCFPQALKQRKKESFVFSSLFCCGCSRRLVSYGNLDCGWLPLHYACAKNAPLSIIKLLALHYPAALGMKACNNKTPLDWAREPDNLMRPVDENIEWLTRMNKSGNMLILSESYLFLKNHWIYC